MLYNVCLLKLFFEWETKKNLLNFAGYKVRKGWSINLDVVSIHHDPEVFSNPEKFDPSRFDASYFLTRNSNK